MNEDVFMSTREDVLLEEVSFRPSGAPNHWKNAVFRDFPTFSRICIFFLLTLLSSNLSLLSASSLLRFSSVHIDCRKFDF